MIYHLLKSEISRSTAIVFLGSAASALMAFVVNAIFARKLGPADYGVLSASVVFMNLLIQMSDLGTGKTVVRMASGSQGFGIEKDEVYTFAFYLRGMVSIILSIACFFSAQYLSSNLFNHKVDIIYIKLISTGVFLGAVGQTFVFMMQEREEFLSSSLNKVTMATAKIILVIIFISYFGINIFNSIVITLCALFAGVMHAFIYSKKIFKFGKKIRIVSLKVIFKYFKWISVVQISSIVMINAPVIILTIFSTKEEIGYYFAAINVSLGFSILAESLVAVLLPKVSKESNPMKLQAMVNNITKKLMIFILPGLVLMIFSTALVELVYGKSYLKTAFVLDILIIAAIVDLIFIMYSTMIYRINKIHFASVDSIIRLSFLLVIGITLVGRLGAMGMALAALLNSLVSAGFRYFIVRRDLQEITLRST